MEKRLENIGERKFEHSLHDAAEEHLHLLPLIGRISSVSTGFIVRVQLVEKQSSEVVRISRKTIARSSFSARRHQSTHTGNNYNITKIEVDLQVLGLNANGLDGEKRWVCVCRVYRTSRTQR